MYKQTVILTKAINSPWTIILMSLISSEWIELCVCVCEYVKEVCVHVLILSVMV